MEEEQIKYFVADLNYWLNFFEEIGKYVIQHPYSRNIFVKTFEQKDKIKFVNQVGTLELCFPAVKKLVYDLAVEKNTSCNFVSDEYVKDMKIVKELLDKIYESISRKEITPEELIEQQKDFARIVDEFKKQNKDLLRNFIQI